MSDTDTVYCRTVGRVDEVNLAHAARSCWTVCAGHEAKGVEKVTKSDQDWPEWWAVIVFGTAVCGGLNGLCVKNFDEIASVDQ
jgi:hypothetical protein